MNDILVVAPNPSVYRTAVGIVTEANLDIHVVLADSDDAVEQVIRELPGETGVVVARGHQAQMIKARTNMTVVNITVSAMDMIILLHQAKQMLRTPYPRIALVGSRHIFADCTALAYILDVDPYVYYANTGDDTYSVVDQAISDGAILIIGNEGACRQAALRGVPSLFMDSMKESVLSAIRSAVHTRDAIMAEHQRAAEFSSLLDYSFNAILKLDAQGRIENGNYLAERILHHPINELRGKPLFEMPAVALTPVLEDALREHRSTYGTTLRIGSESYVLNIAALEVDGKHEGFMVSLQEFRAIRELEEAISDGYRQRGYIAGARFDDQKPLSGRAAAMIDDAKRYAQFDVPVLITGEPGLPMAEIAQCIHNASLRKKGPFVTADLNTIPQETQTDLLFGFDGTPSVTGLVSVAHSGTLFVQNVQLLTAESQRQLLNVLRNALYYRRGSTSLQSASVRVLCSATTDLVKLVQDGRFLEPLAGMLMPASLEVPPLRTIPQDLPGLMMKCMDKACAKYKKPLTLTAKAEAVMAQYAWPENMQELILFCERMVILSPGPRVDENFVRERLAVPDKPEQDEPPVLLVVDEEEARLRGALREAGQNRSRAAAILGISRSTLWRRMQKYGVR